MQKQQTLDTFLTQGTRALSPPRAPSQVRFGLLGQRRDLTEKEIAEIFDLIAEDFPEVQALIVPSEGDSSIYAEAWAEKKKIPVTVHAADWRRDGRRAQIFRDNRIIHDATHFLIFGGPRSERPLKTAEQLTRKGKIVYYLAHDSMELQQFEVAPIKESVIPSAAAELRLTK
jgi:hypothetical protein